MVKEIRIYIEGGGDEKDSIRKLREGFGKFLRELVDLCRRRKIRWNLILCGGRQAAYEDFCAAVSRHPDAQCVLLVDSEAAVVGRPWEHLRRRDNWTRPDGVSDERCHLMAQVMESWFLADPEALGVYYGQGFQKSSLPSADDVETIEKSKVEDGLKNATRHTKTKGEYHKVRHGAELLQRINPTRVCARAFHCRRLFEKLKTLIES